MTKISVRFGVTRELDRLRQLERNAATAASRPSGYPTSLTEDVVDIKNNATKRSSNACRYKRKGRDPGPPDNDQEDLVEEEMTHPERTMPMDAPQQQSQTLG